jgi:hypothetical protein
MIRVSLAHANVEHLEHEIEPRRPHETLYDFTVRAMHETTLEVRALRALLDAHALALSAERAAVARQTTLLLVGQSIVAGAGAAVVYGPETLSQGCVVTLLVALITGFAGELLHGFATSLDRLHARLTRWWQ